MLAWPDGACARPDSATPSGPPPRASCNARARGTRPPPRLAQSGGAERACIEAKNLLQSALNAADVDAQWRAVLDAEAKIIEARR